MDQLINDFSLGLFFWQVVILLILIFLMAKFAWKPILNSLNEREHGIESAMASAEAAREEMKKLKAANEDAAKEARAKRDEMIKEAREIKDKMISDASTEAQEKADKIIAQARENIDSEKRAALAEIKAKVAELSVEIAEKITRKELSERQAQLELIDKMLADANIKKQS